MTSSFAEDMEFDPLAIVAAERDAYLDGLQRLKAEFDNFRKRADRDVLEARARARMGLLTEFLPVLDNLERALSAAEHHEEGKVLEGVRLTHSMFADLLRKEGVTELDPLGATFDPHLHEALMTQPSDQRRGYGDRGLRARLRLRRQGAPSGQGGRLGGTCGGVTRWPRARETTTRSWE